MGLLWGLGITVRSLRGSNWPHASASYRDTADLRMDVEVYPVCINVLQMYGLFIHLFILCMMILQEKTVASSQTTTLSTPELISPALVRDLQDYRKTSLNLVSVHIVGNRSYLLDLFFTAHGISSVSLILIGLFLVFQPTIRYFCSLQSVSGSGGLVVATLTLILYTISLHITASAGVSHVRHFKLSIYTQAPKSQQLGAAIWGILHAIPAIGILAVTSVELMIAVKSPAVAVSIIISCFLPTMIAVFQYLRLRYMIDQLPMIVPGDLPSEVA